jgi:hypothetical protein
MGDNAKKIELKTRFPTNSNKLHVEEFMPTTKELLEEHA